MKTGGSSCPTGSGAAELVHSRSRQSRVTAVRSLFEWWVRHIDASSVERLDPTELQRDLESAGWQVQVSISDAFDPGDRRAAEALGRLLQELATVEEPPRDVIGKAASWLLRKVDKFADAAATAAGATAGAGAAVAVAATFDERIEALRQVLGRLAGD